MDSFKRMLEVDIHDVDFNGVCRTSSILKYIQSAAQTQLTENGMSYEQLRDMNRAFIISKMKLELTETVKAYDRLVAESFPCFSRGFSFIRCYGLYREERMIGRAISVWALVDTEKHSLVKVNDFNLNLPTYEPWEMELAYFKLPEFIQKVGEYTVCYADIDQNMHINNTKYADIFANYLPLNNRRISSLSINYVNEAKYRDKLDVYMAEADGFYYIRTVRPDGKTNAEAKIALAET